ncbi:MAG TPA: hypothetical protein VF270_13875 [Ignavibacteriaceae bacterium]
MEESILDRAKASTAMFKEKVVDLTENLWDDERKEMIGEFKDATSEKLKTILESLGKFNSLFKEAGYELNSINASIALPPDISITFKCLDLIPISERINVFNKAQDSRIATLVLKSLFRASDYSDTIKLGEFKLKTVNIKMGLIPGVSVSFS